MCNRCNWVGKNELMIKYHDTEWGVPLHDDKKLFEFLILESFQAGLSWQIVLNKREAFRKAFNGFDPAAVADYGDEWLNNLMMDKSIIRNRQKLAASINNARCFIEVQEEFNSFDTYIWSFVDFKPIINAFSHLTELPARTEISDKIAVDLKKRGFRFTGPTIVYAHMQATGMVNDHLVSCFRYHEINGLTAPTENALNS